MRAEWRRAPDFAEIAETLGVKTTQIVAAQHQGRGMVVVYSPDDQDHERVVKVDLMRDNDDILQRASLDEEVPGFFEQIHNELRRKLGGEDT